MKTKRFLSILLSLVLVLGMLPGMSLTAFADNNTTTITPGTDDAKTGTGTMTITLKIKAAQNITASDVTATYGDTNKSVSATTDGNGEISYTVKAGSENYIDVNASTGALTIKAVPADGKAYVTVTAAETTTGGTGSNGYAAATKDVTVNISKATVTIAAKDQSIYVGGTVPTLSGADFYTVSGLVGEETLTTNLTLAYQKNGEAATPDNTTAGTYDIVPSGASAGDNYNISYTNGTLTISNKGTQTISADNVTATYGDTNKSVSATVTEPATGGGDISYAVKDGSGEYIDVDATTGALTIKKVPADGKAYVTVTAAETATYTQATKDVIVTISKADSAPATVTANNRTYDGTEKPLVTVDESTLVGGTMYYAVTTENTAPTDNNLYTTSIPAKTNVGTYYVWYRVVGDVNHNDCEPSCVETVISKAVIAPTVSITGWTYGQEANAPSVTGNTGNGTVTYTYAVKNGTTFTSTVPTNAGEYTVKAVIAATTNYAGSVATADFTISKAAIAPTVSIEGWTYGEEANEPSVTGNAGEADVIYTYAVKGSNEYTEIVPTQAGEYTVKAVVAVSSNYEGEVATADFTISKAAITPTVSIEGWTYGEEANEPSVTGNAGEADVIYTYAVKDSDEYTEIVPNQAGEYTVKAVVVESSNYEGEVATADFVISKASIESMNSLTAKQKASAKKMVYNGKNVELVKAPASLPEGYVKAMYSINGGKTWTNAIPKGKNAGKYTVLVKFIGDSNHNDFECTALKSEITKANITITAINKSTYLEADIAKLTYKISGAYVKGDNLGITLKTTAKKTSAVGKYPITISWNKNSNYNVTLKKGTYTIKDRVTATERAASKLTLDYGFKVNWTNDGIVVKWGKANKADRFEIYAAYCGPDNCKLIKAVSGKNQQYTFTKINGKNLDKTKTAKIYVVAYRKINGKEVRITNTIMAHVVGPQHKNTNVKKVTVSKNSYTLQKGKTAKISADVTLVNTKKDALPNSHCPKFRYTSDNKDVATVDSNGKIKAVGKGTCNVYVYGVNGCAAKVKVTVK